MERDLVVSERDGVTVVRFHVESLIGHDVEHLAAEVRGLIDGGVRKLVLDFKHVHFAGSAVLGMVLSLSQAMNAAGGRIVLSHTEHIASLLKVTRSDRMFTIVPDAQSAVAAFNEPPPTAR